MNSASSTSSTSSTNTFEKPKARFVAAYTPSTVHTLDEHRVVPMVPTRSRAALNKKRARGFKGSEKKQKAYTSILVVPHNAHNKKVREMHVHAPFLKFTAIFLAPILIIAACIFYTGYVIDQNGALNSKITTLNGFISKQNNFIQSRVDEINKMQDFQTYVSSKISEFADKYKSMAGTYLLNRTEVAVSSRSGDRTDKDFIADVNDMRSILTTLAEIKNNDGSLVQNLPDIQNKLIGYLNSIPTAAPINGAIVTTSGFGYRLDPFTHLRALHEGLDITASYGTSIKATASGTIIIAGWDGGYGKCVRIDHGNGLISTYGHCSKLLVTVGQYIQKGAVIAKVGSTGRSTAPHLHYEIELFGQKINPFKFLGK